MLGRFLGPELVSDNRSLILEGPPGTGRHIYVLPLPIKRSRTALSLVSPLPLLINELHSSCDINNALKSYTNPHVLVIDEMGYLGYGPDAADILSKCEPGAPER